MSLNLSQGPTLPPVFRTDAEIDRRDEWVRKINDAATDQRTAEVRVESGIWHHSAGPHYDSRSLHGHHDRFATPRTMLPPS